MKLQEKKKNFATLLDMIDASEVREDDETYMNPIDRLFEALEKKRDYTFLQLSNIKKYKTCCWSYRIKKNTSSLFEWKMFCLILFLLFERSDLW